MLPDQDKASREADNATKIQAVVLQNMTKKKLVPYSLIALTKSYRSIHVVNSFENIYLPVKVETRLQVKGLLALAFFNDGSSVPTPILVTSILQRHTVKEVFCSVLQDAIFIPKKQKLS